MKGPGVRLYGPVLAGLATALAVTIACADPMSGLATVDGAAVTSTVTAAPLTQLNPCGGSDDEAQARSGISAGGGTWTSFRIAPSTIAEVDGNGHITAVATNTGCIPQAWNQFYVLAANGSYQPAGSSDVNQLLNASYSGDWTTPGQFHAFS